MKPRSIARSLVRLVKRPLRRRPRIVMTLLCRDEEDIIGYNIAYHLAQGVDFVIATDNASRDRTPLVLSSRSRALVRITDEAAAEAIKAVFADAARAADAQGDQDTAATLRHASAHWLRHSMLTNHANNGVQLKTLQDTAGHANIATTAAYLHKTDNERHDEIIRSANGQGIL